MNVSQVYGIYMFLVLIMISYIVSLHDRKYIGNCINLESVFPLCTLNLLAYVYVYLKECKPNCVYSLIEIRTA